MSGNAFLPLPCSLVRIRTTAVLLVSMLAAFGSSAHAQTGVSDERVSLPDGPGSIDGIGDNVSIDANMGAMSYSVPIEVPEGHPGMKPDLALRYSSMAGSSVVGVGWSFAVPSIERLTLRGLPEYDRDDEMAANGSEQLVRVAETMSTATYRARFERGFVRYTWHAVADGRAGYWTAEWPDGRVGYFGADAAGTIVPGARLEQGGDTFRWMLVEVVDPFDHRLRYDWDAATGTPLLTRVHWVHGAGGTPRYEVALEYGARPDPISDASPGFEERLAVRLTTIRVRARGEVIRTHRLVYEDAASSGGGSRLERIERSGRSGGRYPITLRFGYSRSLSGVCGDGVTEGCDRPFVVDMGSVPGAGALGRGDATLVDIDGDALPDLLDTSLERHRFYLNRLGTDGQGHFDPAARESALGTRTPYALAQASVQVLDVNGDGFADLVDALGGSFLCNLGEGDWVDPSDAANAARCGAMSPSGVPMELDEAGGGASDPDPLRTRFVDLNGDRRIDVLRTDSASVTRAWVSTPAGFTELSGLEALGAQFDGDAVQLAEMNGDGLLDVVWIDDAGTLRYRLSYGRGRFSRDAADRAFRVADSPAIGSSGSIQLVQLEDLNGDGLDDMVLVEGSTVSFAINRNVGRFDPWRTIDVGDVPELPSRLATTTVLFADMNGTGSRDVVWVEQSGQVRYLEIFPVRPNLLSRVENGIGMVHAVTYGRSVAHRAASEEPWPYPLTSPMAVVDRTDTWVTLTGGETDGLHDVVEYGYRDGFYDGAEKAFRGFGQVEIRSLADAARDGQEPSRVVEAYDLGVDDPYRAGLVLTRQTFSGAEQRPLREERHTHEDCPVAEAGTGGLFPIRHLCETEALTLHQEGAAPEEWATTRIETAYDGYGNVTSTVEHGVVHLGPPEAPRACAPCASNEADRFGGACGDSCLGDERYTEREYIVPGSATADRWITGAHFLERSYAVPGGPASESRTFYDGPDFEGLAEGRLERGRATRTVQRASGDEEIEVGRAALDAHGNIVVNLDPLGSASDTGGHRRAYTYDDDGLRVTRTEVFATTPEGEHYRLRQEYAYEPALDRVVETSGWMIDGADAASARNATYYAYDEHARLVAIAKPGDSLDAPTMEVSYELGDPASRIVLSQRSTSGEAPDVITARCLDGRGRLFQELNQVRDGEWLATGFVAHNRRGATVRVYQPYTVSSGACATAEPEGVRHVVVTYDGLDREVSRRLPDDGASEARHEYLPLAERIFDEEDLDPESLHRDTPELVRMDGLGRPIALTRLLRTEAGVEPAVTSIVYDGRGNVAGFVDPAGNEKRQTFDLVRRLIRIDDPSSGATTLEHDAAGNVIARTDARGVTTRTEYDGVNRPVARYDARDPEGTRVDLRYDLAPGCAWPDCANAESQLVEASYPLPEAIAHRLGGARGVDRVGYDARGRAVRHERRLGAMALVREETFDGLDRMVSTRFPDGQTLERRFDGAGRLVAIDGLVERVDHDERGQIARVVRADGSDEVMEHDALMRLARMTTVAGGGAVVQDNTYARDRRGQILEVTNTAGAQGALDTGTSRFTYDSLHRLTRADVAIGLGHEESLTFEHDLIDNLIGATSSLGAASAGHVGDLTYGAARPSIATQVGQLVQAHDDAGFLAERDGTELAWDFLGRLTEARRDGETTGVFAYGADQHRVAKLEGGALTLYSGRDFEVRDGVSRAYARIGRDRVARSQSTALAATLYDDPDGDGEITAADALLEDDAALREGLVRASARRLLHEAAPEPVQLYQDHLGSLVAATRDGEIVGRAAYHPFGETRAESGFIDERGFTGQERDASTRLLAFEFRYLDTYGGQWASADPAFEAIGDLQARAVEHFARYAYVRGDPTNLVDPRGLTGEQAAAAPRANYVDLMARLSTLDFRTPENGAVFWSSPNKEAAQRWARENGGKTIEMTDGGRYLESLRLFEAGSGLTGEQANKIWQQASRLFADGARGVAHAFADGSSHTNGHGQVRTFPGVELPRLLRAVGRVTELKFRSNTGAHIASGRMSAPPPAGSQHRPVGHQ